MGKSNKILTLNMGDDCLVKLEVYDHSVKIIGDRKDLMVDYSVHQAMENLIKLNPDFEHYDTMRYVNVFGAVEVVMFFREKQSFWRMLFSRSRKSK